jgi:hypothetical protein
VGEEGVLGVISGTDGHGDEGGCCEDPAPDQYETPIGRRSKETGQMTIDQTTRSQKPGATPQGKGGGRLTLAFWCSLALAVLMQVNALYVFTGPLNPSWVKMTGSVFALIWYSPFVVVGYRQGLAGGRLLLITAAAYLLTLAVVFATLLRSRFA